MRSTKIQKEVLSTCDKYDTHHPIQVGRDKYQILNDIYTSGGSVGNYQYMQEITIIMYSNFILVFDCMAKTPPDNFPYLELEANQLFQLMT